MAFSHFIGLRQCNYSRCLAGEYPPTAGAAAGESTALIIAYTDVDASQLQDY